MTRIKVDVLLGEATNVSSPDRPQNGLSSPSKEAHPEKGQ